MKYSEVFLSSAAIVSFLAIQDIHAEGKAMNKLHLASQAFAHNGMIPPEYTCDGTDGNPPLTIRNAPANSRSLALIVDDPDAPRGTWVHRVVWNIGPDTTEIPANSAPGGALQGTNDFGKQSYGGPCPPSGTHRYFFKLYALDIPLALKTGATKAQLEEAMKGHILEKAELVGLYRRR
jgi:Raf kinase inhibitor-like YbhB/YbcL family protein